jgi:hypothetical protein
MYPNDNSQELPTQTQCLKIKQIDNAKIRLFGKKWLMTYQIWDYKKPLKFTSHGPQELTTKKNYKTTNGMIIIRIN